MQIEKEAGARTQLCIARLAPGGVTRNLLRLTLLLVATCLLNNCTMVQSSMWTSFVDDLDTGSKIEPESPYLNAEGELHVKITKAASHIHQISGRKRSAIHKTARRSTDQ